MLEIITANEMKQAEAACGIPPAQLMEAAGASVAQKIIAVFKPCPVLVLCGPGNNGGDGFVAARHLARAGWPVRVACTVKKNNAEPLNSNLPLKDAGLVVDAIFGTGAHGDLPPEIVTLFDKIRAKNIPVAAVAVPSGIDATTGAVADGVLRAALTVTFCRKKIAHVILPSKPLCGAVHVAEIGITDDRFTGDLFENHPALWIADFPLPGAGTHKYDRGHAVVLGGAARTGAACLAAAAAQKAGAGLVTIAAPAAAKTVYQCYRASLIVDAWDTVEDLKGILRDPRRNVFILGPGAGEAREAIDAALSFGRPAVLDGDVFTLYAGDAAALFAKLSDKHVLTPHEGECERLFGHLSGDKIERARKAAKTSGAVVVLKGHDTVIAGPGGAALVNTNAPPTLATAGSGDVLAGLIGGLMAQGMPSFMAAGAGVWLHAKAAQIYGPGLVADDIISNINQSLRYLFTSPSENT
jgi:NAD(P)H-hydrate epimerase